MPASWIFSMEVSTAQANCEGPQVELWWLHLYLNHGYLIQGAFIGASGKFSFGQVAPVGGSMGR